MAGSEQYSGEYFVISVAAELTGMHAQTLRTYDRMAVSYTHLTLPTIQLSCRSRWSPYH